MGISVGLCAATILLMSFEGDSHKKKKKKKKNDDCCGCCDLSPQGKTMCCAIFAFIFSTSRARRLMLIMQIAGAYQQDCPPEGLYVLHSPPLRKSIRVRRHGEEGQDSFL